MQLIQSFFFSKNLLDVLFIYTTQVKFLLSENSKEIERTAKSIESYYSIARASYLIWGDICRNNINFLNLFLVE